MPPKRRLTAYEKRVAGARSGWRCEACGELLDEAWEADHRVPLHQGGEDSLDNVQSLCHACHRAKTIREEIARVRARRNAARACTARPPLSCTRCDQIVSPYFVHRCPPR